ncbi:hypothetical protein GCM10009690_31790 [Brevibacterium permense]|uniref:Uncharacterized protein n=1 Tax=Brevibacterium permense TaxID=234834 RepID=A0ABP4LKN7_9MICO
MIAALKLTAWILVGLGLIVSVAFLAGSNSGPYPLWALLPNIGALVLMVPILNYSRRRERH